MPTPHGLIKINLDGQRGIILELPRGVSKASVSFTPPNRNADVYVNGRLSYCVKCLKNEPREPVRVLELAGPGHYEITSRLDFCAEHGVVAETETIPLQEIETAFARMVKNDIKYRFVVDMKSLKRNV